MKFYIQELSDYQNFYPLALNRYIQDLPFGIYSLRERLSLYLKEDITDLSSERFFSLQEEYLTGFIFVAHIIFTQKIKDFLSKETVFVDEDNNPVLFYVENIKQSELYQKKFITNLLQSRKTVYEPELYKFKMNSIADFIIHQQQQLEFDLYNDLSIDNLDINKDHLSVEGKVDDLFVSKDSNISSFAVFNTKTGRILIEDGVSIGALSYIEGPCIIKKDAVIDQAKIRGGVYIGQGCKIGGEVESSVFLPYSNKHHEGFVGHSYIGSFVNFGALSTTSDLKNNYHSISLSYLNTTIQTNSIKIGSFIGDYTKLGIGSLLNTGSMIGLGCSLFIEKAQFFPKFIPSFSWGGFSETRYRWDSFINDTRLIMSRRKKELSSEEELILKKIYQEKR